MRFAIASFVVAAALSATCAAAPGDLDPGFGRGGTVVADLGIDGISGLALQPDGGILVAGARNAFGGSPFAVIARFDAAGRRDPSFGGGGSLTEPGAFGAVLFVQADGSFVVAGPHACDGPNGCVAFLRRYDAHGRIDPAFAAPDRAVEPPTIPEVIVAQGEQLVVGGNAGHAPGFLVWLARHEASGAADPTFGTDGTTMEFVSSHGASLGSLVVMPDGSLVAGVTGSTGEGVFSRLERFTTSGANTGAVPILFGHPFLALTPEGSIVAVGTLQSNDQPTPRIAIARFGADLAPDAAGTSTGPVGAAGAVVADPDGAVVVAAALGDQDARRFAVVRFTDGDTLDPGFGQGGVATVLPDTPAAAQLVVRQPDGALVAAGAMGGSVPAPIVLARVLDRATAGVPRSTTTTTLVGGTTPTTLPPEPCAVDGACDDGDACTLDRCVGGHCAHDALLGIESATCLCAAVPACQGRRGAVVGARLAHACALLTQAADAPAPRARRLLRRAIRLLRADRHAMADGVRCADEMGARVMELERRTRGLLAGLRARMRPPGP